MPFELPPKSKVGYLDPEIAGEGQKVILSDGEQVSWTPPPPQPVMPDWSRIKSIARYFGRQGHQVYPAWLYHPTEEPRLVKNADEAGELGVCYRKATTDERGRYGLDAVWDWKEDCEWRPKPYGPPKFDPLKLGTGKTYMPAPANPVNAQNQLLEALIPAVAAAVAKSLNADGPGKPANIDSKQWDDFLKFKAWQESSSAVSAVAAEAGQASDQSANALDTSSEDEKASWITEAERKNVKIDKRWGLDRIKSEVEKAA